METKSLVRIRRSKAQWNEIVKRQVASGLSVEEFCRAEGIAESHFRQWSHRILEVKKAKFLELTLNGSHRVRAELDFGQGMVLRIFG